jgi:hypothetical protein
MSSNAAPLPNILTGNWTYRSFLNDPDPGASFDSLEFGLGTLRIDDSPLNEFAGVLEGDGWSLQLQGSTTWGNPFEVRFQGSGVVEGEEWKYDYLGYVVKPWPNGVDQRMAIVGSIVRTLPDGDGAPAGEVCSWIAVKQDPEIDPAAA